MSKIIRVVVAFVCLFLVIPNQSVNAIGSDRFISTSGVDTGDCSTNPCRTLAYAIDQADDGDTIMLSSGIFPTNVSIDKNLTIQGIGMDLTTLDGSDLYRVLLIQSSAEVILSDLAIMHGNSWLSSNNDGAGVYNEGTLTLSKVIISNNQADAGGGIFTEGSLFMTDCILSYNTATGGGGLFINPSRQIAVSLERVSVINNSATWYTGAIVVQGDQSSLVSLTNVTVSGNTASDVGGILVKDLSPITSIVNTTISNNSGGVKNLESISIRSTIISGNSTFNCSGTGDWNSLGNNLQDSTDCNLTDVSDIQNTDPLLEPLADNGGFTPTMALSENSPAIDTGTNIDCPTIDQRGVRRPVGSLCDIGAYEYVVNTQPETVIDVVGPPDSPTNNTSLICNFDGFDNESAIQYYECSFDAAPYAICESPFSMNGLSEGAHIFNVRAVDLLDAIDETPALFEWTVDTTNPSVLINQASEQLDPTLEGVVLFTASFSEPILGFEPGDISFTGSTAPGTFSATIIGDGPSYTISVSGMTNSGTVVVSIPSDAVTDIAGNLNTSSIATDNSVTYVDPAPTTTFNQSDTQSDPVNHGPILFTAVFSEPIVGFTSDDIDFTGSTVSGALAAAISGDGPTYTVSVSGMTGDGSVMVSIPADVVTDVAGNSNGISSSLDNSVVFDITSPTVTLDQAVGQDDPINAGPILFTAVFSEPVVGFTSGDIDFTGSTVSGTLAAAISGDGPIYTVSVSGMTGDGSVMVSIPADVVTDEAGNSNFISSSSDNMVRYDDIAPSVTINQSSDQRDPATQIPLKFEVIFSEQIVGFSGNDVSFSGSTTPGELIATIVGGGPTFTVFVSGMSRSGVITVSIPAATVQDLAGNNSLASSSIDNEIRYIAPVLWIPLSH